MLEKIISKQDYSEKRAELDLELENLEKGKLELQTSKGVPIETVKDRIKHLKEQVNNSLYKEKGDFTQEFIYKFTHKIIIREDCIEWYLNYLDSLNQKVISDYNYISFGLRLFFRKISFEI